MAPESLQSSKLKLITEEVGRAYNLVNSGKHAEGRELLQQAHAESKRLGLVSSYVLWSLAVASDYLSDHENSTRYIQEAIALDPLSPQLRRSFDIIASHIRVELTSPERAVDDPEVPVLYELLLRVEEADLESHLRMANWHFARANHTEARALLEALSLLFPASLPVWELLAKVASVQEDDGAVERCSRVSASMQGRLLPRFVMPKAEG